MSDEATLDEFGSDDSTDEWSEEKLRNLVKKDEAGVWGDEASGNGVRVLRATNYAPNSVDLNDVAVRDIPESKKGPKQLKPGDIVVERSGGSADQPVGRVLFFDLDGEYYHGNFLRQLRPDSSKINSQYLYYRLDYDYRRGHTKQLQTNTTNIRNLQYSSYLNQTVPTPPKPQQRKIATVLYTVDRAIEKTEELVSQTERVKTGLTQDLLSRGINNQQMVETDSRFGLLPEAWELRPLKEFCEIAGRTAPEKDDTECWGGDIPWATPSEITSLVGQTINDTEEHLTELALEKVSSNLLPPMSVLMTTRATIGECAVNTVEMTTNQGFKNVIPGEALDTWYAYYRLDYERDYLASLSKGSTFPEVGKDTVENFVIPVPPIEEQREIGELLQSVDEQILSYKESKSQYKRLKRGLMQDLLSGTVRTTDTNIQVPEKITQYG